MIGKLQPTLRSPVKIQSDEQLGLTPDRTHEIAEGMLAIVRTKEAIAGMYAAAVVREGFAQSGVFAWAEVLLKGDGHASVGIYANAPERLAARLRAEGKVV